MRAGRRWLRIGIRNSAEGGEGEFRVAWEATGEATRGDAMVALLCAAVGHEYFTRRSSGSKSQSPETSADLPPDVSRRERRTLEGRAAPPTRRAEPD